MSAPPIRHPIAAPTTAPVETPPPLFELPPAGAAVAVDDAEALLAAPELGPLGFPWVALPGAPFPPVRVEVPMVALPLTLPEEMVLITVLGLPPAPVRVAVVLVVMASICADSASRALFKAAVERSFAT